MIVKIMIAKVKSHFLTGALLSILMPIAKADVRVVGNGGHVVVCKNSAGRMQSIDVLDGYEARHMGTIDLGHFKLSVEEKVQIGLKRIKALDATLADDLILRAKEFFKTAGYYAKLALPDSSDEGEVVLADGCGLHQIALQRLSSLPQGRSYLINDRFWKMLSNDQRAVLVLHEVIYSYITDKGAVHSKPARLLNALVIQNKLTDMKPSEFSEFLKRIIEDSKMLPSTKPLTTSVAAPVPEGTVFFETLNESFFKTATAQSRILADDKKCYLTPKMQLAVELIEAPNKNHDDHYKVKLRQIIPGCPFGVEGTVGYLYANHVRIKNN